MDVLSLTLIAQRSAALSGQDVRDIPTWVIDAMREAVRVEGDDQIAYEKGYAEGQRDKELRDAD